jgi:hypothetical protein
LVLFIVATFVSMALVAYSQRPTIPFIEGLELAAAQQEFGDDFKLVRSEEKSCQPKGTILSQSPKPGAETQWVEKISVVVSAGRPKSAQLPDVMDKPRDKAERILTDKGLKVEVETKESSKEDVGKVLEQSPPACEMKKDSKVAITIGEYSPPSAEVNPRGLEFGEQEVGSTSVPPGTVILTNEGSTLLNISNIAVNDDFGQKNDCGSVEPGASCSIRVTFTPTAQGDRNGTLTISHNAPGGPEEVPLSGDGTPAVNPKDQMAPTITITSPADEAVYTLNQPVKADYSCVATEGSELASCTGTNGTSAVSNGGPIDTSTAGSNSFTVTATDNAGNTNSLTHNYKVGPARPAAEDPDRSAPGHSQYANN